MNIDMLRDLTEQKGLKITGLYDLVSHLKVDDTTRLLLPEFIHAVRLILTVSLTTCTDERSFTQLSRPKSYLRSTLTQARLNYHAILNCHNHVLKQINDDGVADDFIVRITVRRNTFALKQQHN